MKRSVIILLHIGYWALYLLLVTSFLIAMANNKVHKSIPGMGKLIISTSLGLLILLPAVTGFYSFYTFLFTRFLTRRKLVSFFIASLLVVIASGFLPVLVLLLEQPENWRVNNNASGVAAMTIFLSMLALVNGVIGTIMKGFINWYKDIRVKEELKRKNYEVELALIKSQINPHFLFNTINNIDVLIGKDPVKASAYLNKLSDIMRFMLYETKSAQVALSEELAYIEKYVELQRIRTSNPNYVQFTVEGACGNYMIEPMLFIPFIENAFKHSEYRKNEGAVRILFSVGNNSLRFTCENRFIKSTANRPGHSGLGNDIIRKRLELLYPGKHNLSVKEDGEFYKVYLVLTNHEN